MSALDGTQAPRRGARSQRRAPHGENAARVNLRRATRSTLPAPRSATTQDSAEAAVVALSFARRVLVEGAPATRETLAREASFLLGRPADEALRSLDATGQRLGVSSLL